MADNANNNELREGRFIRKDSHPELLQGVNPLSLSSEKEQKMHYYKRNLGDYAKKAGRLSMLQHGSYTLLIDSCYDREQFPTLDEAIEWTWASSKEEREAVEFVLNKFFELMPDGRFVQSRIQQELDAYHENAKTNKRIADEREAKRKGLKTDGERTVHEAPPNHKPLTINQKPLTKNQDKTNVKQTQLDVCSEEVIKIFEFWKKTMNSPRSELDDTRKRLIKKALKSYSPADVCKAIRGCSKSPHNMGQNESKTKYNGLDLILRNADKIDRFIALDAGNAISSVETFDERNARIEREVMCSVDYADQNTIDME